jgi:hypothetical protein
LLSPNNAHHIYHTSHSLSKRSKDRERQQQQSKAVSFGITLYFEVIDIEYDSTENEVSLALCFSAARERGSITVVWKKRS